MKTGIKEGLPRPLVTGSSASNSYHNLPVPFGYYSVTLLFYPSDNTPVLVTVRHRKLESLLGGDDQSQLSKLVWDAYRFALAAKSIIEQAPLQAYISALVFAPRNSWIKRNFRAEEPEWIRTKPAVELDWNACLQTLEGHRGNVSSVAFSPDGQRLASGSEDETIKIWDPASGSCLQTLEGHRSSVGSVAFSPDGQWLASGSWDETIKIWDPASGSCLQTLEGHRSYVRSVAFSPDGQRLASGSDDETIKIWDPASGSCLQTIPTSTLITDISFDPTSRYLVTNIGRINIVTETTKSQVVLEIPESHGYALGKDRSWITCNGQNVLWLPPNYRPSSCYVQGQMISFICTSGLIWFISVSQDM
ncbi:hypothetical protein SMAC4_13252 [Sordaria macrospora]|uniref:uncharacterized protein n=1 Tax=Sordaria macrospora TaxID=5147 RepID=UPI002B3153F7|nr:hypothetical protein SMAC4_13252 [Sordaria macrospora]